LNQLEKENTRMAETASSATDIPSNTWIDRLAPMASRPYLRLARLDRPIGTWLLLLPCWWSTALATNDVTDPMMWKLFVLFSIGAFVMRGAGCTLNDIVDRDFDGRVTRTAARPIPSGEVTVRQAILFLCLQLGIGLGVLAQFNTTTLLVGVASLGLIVIYPFAKRYTYWPQFILGLTFNWGALLGWTAVRDQLNWPAVILYLAGVFWTLGYDTIYAHQDKKDDVLVGVKSTALKFGKTTRIWLSGFYATTLILLALMGNLAGVSQVYFLGVAVCGAHLFWQVWTVDIENPADCHSKFKSNRDFGLLLMAAIFAGQLF